MNAHDRRTILVHKMHEYWFSPIPRVRVEHTRASIQIQQHHRNRHAQRRHALAKNSSTVTSHLSTGCTRCTRKIVVQLATNRRAASLAQKAFDIRVYIVKRGRNKYSQPFLSRMVDKSDLGQILQLGLQSYFLGTKPGYPISRCPSTSELISTFLPVALKGTQNFDHLRSLLALRGTQKGKRYATCQFLKQFPLYLRSIRGN